MIEAPQITHLDADPERLDQDALADQYAPTDFAAPMLRVNFVTSLDGAVAVRGHSAGLSDPVDQRLLSLLRGQCDALLVGAGTLRAERYGPIRLGAPLRRWRRERGLPDRDPVLVVVSRSLDLDPAAPAFVEAPRRPVVFAPAGAPADRRAALSAHCDVLTVGDGSVDLPAAVARLRERGLPQILCEGGPYVFGGLTAADLVDELCLTVSPVLTGPGAGRITAGPASQLRRLRLRQVTTAGGSLFLQYRRADQPVDNAVDN